jgi:septal ring factor EnvC (AmiA/AmiB activator)
MSPGLEAGLKEVLARKADVARLTAEGARRRTEIDQITKDQERLRENMKSLKGSAEERQLLQRYVRQLNEQENRIEALRGEAQAIAGQIEKARAELVRAIEAVR